jgi:hypothetical protein
MKKVAIAELFIIALLLGFMLQSCNVAYLPAQHNVPLISSDTEATISLSPSNFQLAGAVSNSIALMAGLQYSFFLANDDGEGSGIFAHYPYQWNLELGAGLFRELRPGLVFELYGGTGTGASNVFQETTNERYHANHFRFFLQPDLGYKHKQFEIALSGKYIFLQYFNEHAENIDDEWLKENDVYDLDKNPFRFIEPALTVRFNVIKDIQIFSQFVYSHKISPEPLSRQEGTIILGICGRP